MTMILADDAFIHVTTIQSLTDAQSGAVLVKCTTDIRNAHVSNPNLVSSCEINREIVTKEKAEQHIDEMMGDDK
jgi:hypothetical protein